MSCLVLWFLYDKCVLSVRAFRKEKSWRKEPLCDVSAGRRRSRTTKNALIFFSCLCNRSCTVFRGAQREGSDIPGSKHKFKNRFIFLVEFFKYGGFFFSFFLSFYPCPRLFTFLQPSVLRRKGQVHVRQTHAPVQSLTKTVLHVEVKRRNISCYSDAIQPWHYL